MKKILIVNNNMKVGGVQKSLYNLLWETEGEFDVTLCLFKKAGEYADKLPPSVKVVEAEGAYRYLGVSQGECCGIDSLMRAIPAALCRLFGRKKILAAFKRRQSVLEEKYDCAISFLHNGRSKSFYGGTQDFVLNCVNAEKKIAFLHCDYRNCGADNHDNNADMARFDVIAACSDGCREAFCSVLPELKNKCVTVRNCHRFEEIRVLADDATVEYDSEYVNVVLVARLSREKGIERALEAVKYSLECGASVRLHIVGGGYKYQELAELAKIMEISDSVFFYGEQSNPYRYMKNADLLLISSYHEAAPMVIDEARSLGVPILTTETTSSRDMVSDMGCGFVCENSTAALCEKLYEIALDREELASIKSKLKTLGADNRAAFDQFKSIIY